MPTNQLTQLDRNLKDCQKHDLDWTLLPENLKEVSIISDAFSLFNIHSFLASVVLWSWIKILQHFRHKKGYKLFVKRNFSFIQQSFVASCHKKIPSLFPIFLFNVMGFSLYWIIILMVSFHLPMLGLQNVCERSETTEHVHLPWIPGIGDVLYGPRVY